MIVIENGGVSIVAGTHQGLLVTYVAWTLVKMISVGVKRYLTPTLTLLDAATTHWFDTHVTFFTHL